MSHIQVSKIIGDNHTLAGREWYYPFGFELNSMDEDAVKHFIDKKFEQFASITKVWNDELNTEWLCRIFFSMKMILAASVMLESEEYALEKNLKVTVPYLQYYSVLYSLKALVLVLPHQKWEQGKLIEKTHSATINIACEEIGKLDNTWIKPDDKGSSTRERILKLKAFRELISYRAPTSGGNLSSFNEDIISLCRVPVELAQMITEILEISIHKKALSDYKPRLIDEHLDVVFNSHIEGFEFYDKEDHYRVGYLYRKHPMPTNILHMMSEGHVEDFFGAWLHQEDSEDGFNPDENWRILFDVP